MDPKVVEQFICLSLNPDSGRYTVLGNYLTYGITGAMLMDLALNEKIKIKDRYILEGDDRSRPGISSYDRMLEKIIDSNRSRTIKKWVQKSGRRSSWYRKEVQKYLVEKGILRQESKRFIGIPYKLHYPAKFLLSAFHHSSSILQTSIFHIIVSNFFSVLNPDCKIRTAQFT